MKSFLLLIMLAFCFSACKKDNDGSAHPVLQGSFSGISYLEQNDLQNDLADVHLSFSGTKFSFRAVAAVTDEEFKLEGREYFTRGADSIYFYGILPSAAQTSQGFKYTASGDSLVMIHQASAAAKFVLRLKRNR